MSTKTVKIPVGKTVIWSVTLEGYTPQQGRYVMEDNPVSLDINLVAYGDPPFTMEFSGTGYLHINADASSAVQFNKNNTGWDTSNTDIPINDGDVIQFRGEYSTFNKHGWTLDSGIVINKVYGNIGSLLDPINYSTMTTYSESLVFSRFFEHMNTVVDASKLILPATTLTERCYDSMFYGCTSLTSAPELPATTLANQCYSNMFNGCTSLTSAPVLPAETLVSYCYNRMFYGCSKLNYIKCLAHYIGATDCTRNWVTGVAPAGTFVKYIGNSSWSTGNSGIPTNWVVRAVDINQYIFAINPTPVDAVVTINGEVRSYIAADYGTAIDWSVSKPEYMTKTGSYTLYDDHVENVELNPQCIIEGTCKNNTAKIGYNRKRSGYFYDYSLFDITYTQVSTNLYRFIARANEVVTSLACAFSLDSNTISVDSDANASSFLTITSMRGTDMCTNAEQMLDGCTSLTSYDLSEANFSRVTNINRMYRNLTGITSNNNKGPSNLKPQTAQFLYMRCGGSSAVVDASDMDWSGLTRAQGSSDGAYGMFVYCDCTNYNLSDLTIGATMYGAFERAGKLNTPMIIVMDNTYVKNTLYRIFGDSNTWDDHISGPLSSQIYIYARRLDPNDQNLIYVNDLSNIETGFWHCGYSPSATDNPTSIGLFPWGNPNLGSAYVGEYYYVYSNHQIVTHGFEKTKYTNGYVSLNISGMTKNGIPDGRDGYVMPTVNFSDGPNGAYDLSAYNWKTGSSYRYNYWYNTTGTTIRYSVSAPGFNTVTGTATPQSGSDTSTGGIQTIDITLTPTS